MPWLDHSFLTVTACLQLTARTSPREARQKFFLFSLISHRYSSQHISLPNVRYNRKTNMARGPRNKPNRANKRAGAGTASHRGSQAPPFNNTYESLEQLDCECKSCPVSRISPWYLAVAKKSRIPCLRSCRASIFTWISRNRYENG